MAAEANYTASRGIHNGDTLEKDFSSKNYPSINVPTNLAFVDSEIQTPRNIWTEV